MLNKLRFTVFGVLLLSACAYTMSLIPGNSTNAFAREVSSSVSTVSRNEDGNTTLLSLQKSTDKPYQQSYRKGYRQGYQDGQQDCSMRGIAPRSPSQSADQGFKDGYQAGYSAGHSAC